MQCFMKRQTNRYATNYINVINFCDLLFSNEIKLFNFIDTALYIFYDPFWDFMAIDETTGLNGNGGDKESRGLFRHNS